MAYNFTDIYEGSINPNQVYLTEKFKGADFIFLKHSATGYYWENNYEFTELNCSLIGSILDTDFIIYKDITISTAEPLIIDEKFKNLDLKLAFGCGFALDFVTLVAVSYNAVVISFNQKIVAGSNDAIIQILPANIDRLALHIINFSDFTLEVFFNYPQNTDPQLVLQPSTSSVSIEDILYKNVVHYRSVESLNAFTHFFYEWVS